MDRIKGAGHINNRFVTEDVATGRPPTEITEVWLNAVQEEIVSVIASAGIPLDSNSTGQLNQAINAIVASTALLFATSAETVSGVLTTRATHPAGVKAAIQAGIAALVNASPAALDTLNELAAALGSDPNFATTMTNALAGKLSTAGGLMAGYITQINDVILQGFSGGVLRGYINNSATGIGFLGHIGDWAALVPYGTVDWYSSGNITAYSDIRVKANVVRIDGALGKVKQLGGYTFDRTDIAGLRQTGVIAQEVLEVLPEAVTTNPENGHYAVAYGNMVGLLIEAIKELSAKVDALEAR